MNRFEEVNANLSNDMQALMKLMNKGCGCRTVDEYSGWNCVPMYHFNDGISGTAASGSGHAAEEILDDVDGAGLVPFIEKLVVDVGKGLLRQSVRQSLHVLCLVVHPVLELRERQLTLFP